MTTSRCRLWTTAREDLLDVSLGIDASTSLVLALLVLLLKWNSESTYYGIIPAAVGSLAVYAHFSDAVAWPYLHLAVLYVSLKEGPTVPCPNAPSRL